MSQVRSTIAAIVVAVTTLVGGPCLAQSYPRYIALEPANPLAPVKAVLYLPDKDPKPTVGVIAMHRTANFLSMSVCTELSKRGFAVLCMNPRSDNNETQVNWDRNVLDLKKGVEFMRAQDGIAKIVVFGHSGGGAAVTYYQAVAEKGVSFCNKPQKLSPCNDELAGLPRADAVILADAHVGNPVWILRSLNPAVTSEGNSHVGKLDWRLDPFDPRNGYNPEGPSHYSEEFQERYFAAQSKRMNALIDTALAKKKRIGRGDYPYPDNDIMIIPRSGNAAGGPAGAAHLQLLDPEIARNHTRIPRRLLQNDGTIVETVVRLLGRADPTLKQSNATFDQGTRIFTLSSFLSANAVRSTNSRDGIDHCSSNNSVICAVGVITTPVMVAGMQANTLIGDAEEIYEAAVSADKDLVFIEGATHVFAPCTECESTPGQYSNASKNFFDYTAKWIDARF